MLRKEFQGVLKLSLFFLAVVAGISFVINLLKNVGSYFEVFYQMYQFSLLAFAAFMGISVFLWDKKQRAEEYVSSLPYSRVRVLAMKLLPRLIAILIFYLLFMALYLWGSEGNVQHWMRDIFFTNSWYYWLLFFMGVSFSASADGYMKVGGIALLGMLLFLLLFSLVLYLPFWLKGLSPQEFPWVILPILTFNFSGNLVPFLVICILLLLPYIISFVLTYKKWGTYSKENYNKGYFKLFIPLMVVGLFFSTFYLFTITSRGYSNYYLTAKHQLIETDSFSTRLVEADGEIKLKYAKGDFIPFFEDEQYVYGTHMTFKSVFIVRIHKENHMVETLRKGVRPDHWYYRYHIRVFQHMIVVSEDYYDPVNRTFVFIDTRSKTTKKMRTAVVLPPGYFEPVIFGADADPNNGKIFWLIHSGRTNKYPIIKLWEDGKAETLCMTWFHPLYINRMLITAAPKALVFSRVTSDGLEVIHKSEYNYCDLHRLYNPINLNPTSFKEIYCIQWTERCGWNHIRMDVDTFEFSRIAKISEKPLRLILTTSGEAYHIDYETRRDNNIYLERWVHRSYLNKIYRLEGEKFILLKEFPPYERKHKFDSFEIFNNGVLIRHNNRLSFYTLPEMKQIEFPGIQ
ncbi:MAG: hypothetical protein JSV88_00080 [Candidatus Aminicenantes bacterium]|nr:MAG: hypothetical protein JSV88_00080 [Candidatus Aminicenantes bacterium]